MLKDRFQASMEIIETIEVEFRDEHIVPKPTKPSPLPIRDPDDRWMLTSAFDGQADLLVTGDQDLLAIAGQRRSPMSIHGAAGIASADSNVPLQLKESGLSHLHNFQQCPYCIPDDLASIT